MGILHSRLRGYFRAFSVVSSSACREWPIVFLCPVQREDYVCPFAYLLCFLFTLPGLGSAAAAYSFFVVAQSKQQIYGAPLSLWVVTRSLGGLRSPRCRSYASNERGTFAIERHVHSSTSLLPVVPSGVGY